MDLRTSLFSFCILLLVVPPTTSARPRFLALHAHHSHHRHSHSIITQRSLRHDHLLDTGGSSQTLATGSGSNPGRNSHILAAVSGPNPGGNAQVLAVGTGPANPGGNIEMLGVGYGSNAGGMSSVILAAGSGSNPGGNLETLGLGSGPNPGGNSRVLAAGSGFNGGGNMGSLAQNSRSPSEPNPGMNSTMIEAASLTKDSIHQNEEIIFSQLPKGPVRSSGPSPSGHAASIAEDLHARILIGEASIPENAIVDANKVRINDIIACSEDKAEFLCKHVEHPSVQAGLVFNYDLSDMEFGVATAKSEGCRDHPMLRN